MIAEPLPEVTPEALAVEFCRVLREWLDTDQMIQVIARNKAEMDPLICHSHDFCDANQAMLDAMEVFGIDFDGPESIPLVNAAWDLAKSSDFLLRKE